MGFLLTLFRYADRLIDKLNEHSGGNIVHFDLYQSKNNSDEQDLTD